MTVSDSQSDRSSGRIGVGTGWLSAKRSTAVRANASCWGRGQAGTDGAGVWRGRVTLPQPRAW